MDKSIMIIFIVFGIIMTVIGIVNLKKPDLGWNLSLSRILNVKGGKPTKFYYASTKISAVFFLILGPLLAVAGSVDLIWGYNATYDIMIDGNEIGIPCAYAELETLGYQLETDEKSKILSAGDVSSSVAVTNSEGDKMLIVIENRDNIDKTKAECDVVSVYVTKSKGPDIQLSNGVTFGMSESKVHSVMGTPERGTGSSSAYSDYYVEQKWANKFEVNIGYKEDGQLGGVSTIRIQLDND